MDYDTFFITCVAQSVTISLQLVCSKNNYSYISMYIHCMHDDTNRNSTLSDLKVGLSNGVKIFPESKQNRQVNNLVTN